MTSFYCTFAIHVVTGFTQPTIQATIQSMNQMGPRHMGTENGFTGSRFPIQIQCGLTWAPHGTQTAAHFTAGLDLTHCHARSTARSSDLDQGRVKVKWSLDADPWSTLNPDPMSRVDREPHDCAGYYLRNLLPAQSWGSRSIYGLPELHTRHQLGY